MLLVLLVIILVQGEGTRFMKYDLADAENAFEQYIKDYNKVYNDDKEKKARFKMFKDVLEELNDIKKNGYKPDLDEKPPVTGKE